MGPIRIALRTLLALGCLAGVASAQSAWTGGAADGNWETGGNWFPAQPAAGDAAVFSDTVTNANATILTAGTDQTIQDLLINTSGNQDYDGTITIQSPRTLTIQNLSWNEDGTPDNPTLSVGGTLVITRAATLANVTGNRITGTGTIRFTNTSGGAQTWSSSAITSWGDVDVNVADQLDTGSNITVADLSISGGVFTVPTGTLTVTGNLTIAAGATLLVNGGTLNVTGTTTVTGTGDLQVSSGSVTLTGGISGTGNLTVSGGTVNPNAFTLTGTVTHSAGTIAFSTASVNLAPATYTSSGTALATFTGTTSLTVDASVGFVGATFNGATCVVTGALTATGTVTVNSGLTLGTASALGALSVANAATFTHTATTGTTTVTGATTVTGPTGLVQITGVGGTVTLTGGITGSGDLTVSANSTLNPNAFTLTGDVTHSAGTIAFSTASVDLSGTATYTSSGTASATFTGTTSLTVDNNVNFVAATFNTNCAMTGRLSASGTVTLNATLSLGAGSSSIGTLGINAGGETLTLATGGGNPCTIGTVNLAAGSINLNGNTLTVSTAFTFGSGSINDADNAASILDLDVTTFAPAAGTLDISHGILQFSGTTLTFTNLNTVTFATSGVLTLDRAAAGTQTVTLKAATDLRDLLVSRGALAQLVAFASVAPQIQGTTAVSAGTLDVTLDNTTFVGGVTIASGAELRCQTASRTTIFQSTVDVAGTLRLGDGATSNIVARFGAGSGNRVRVTTGGQFVVAGDTGGGANNNRRVLLAQDGTSGGAQWFLDYSNPGGGTAMVSRARLQDGNVNPATVATTGSSLDGANNTGWSLTAGTFTWTNGGGTGLWSNANNWAETAVPASGDSVLFTAVGGTSTVDVAGLTLASMDMTNFTGTLTQSQVLNVTGALTVVGTAYNMNSALTVNGAFRIASGTFTAGALLTLNGTTEIDGTLTVGGAGTLACGAISNTSTGTLNGTGTLDLSGTSYDFTNLDLGLTGGTTTFTANGVALTVGGAASDEFFNLTESLAGGTLSVTGALRTQAGGTVMVTAGNLTLASAAHAIWNLDVNAGTFTIAGGTVQVAGGWDLTGAAGFTPNTSTVDFNGAGPQAIVPAGRSFSSVTKTGGGAGSITGPITCTGNLSVSAGSFAVSGACTVSGTTGLTVSGGSYSATGATVVDGTGADLTISGGATVTLGNAANTVTDAVTLSNGTLQGSGGGTLSFTGNWDTTGATTTFTPNGLTVVLTGGGSPTITQANDAFGNLTCNKSGGTAGVSALNVTGTLLVQGSGTIQPTSVTALASLDIDGGTFSNNGQTFTIGTACSVDSPGTLQVTTGTLTLTPALSGNGTLLMNAGGLLNLNGGLTLTGTITHSAGTISVAAGTVNLANLTGGYMGSGTATFTLNTGVSTLVVDNQVAFRNLTIATGATVSMTGSTSGLSVSAALTCVGSLVLGGGNASVASMSLTGSLTLGSNELSLAGTYPNTNTGTLVVGTSTFHVAGTTVNFSGGTVTFAAGGTLDLTASGAVTPNFGANTIQNLSLNLNATGTTVSLGAGTVSGAVSITTGTLDLTADRTFSGAVTIGAAGVLFTNDNGRAVVFNSTVTIAGVFDFDAGNNAQDLSFTPGQAVTVQNGGSFLIDGGASGANQTDLMRVGAAGQWTLTVNVGGTVTVNDANISNGLVSPSQNASSSTDQGGNTGWVFDPKTTQWDNGNATNVWSDDANWSDGAPSTGDTVTFAAVGGTSRVDIAGLTLAAMTMTGFTGALEQDNTLIITGNLTAAGTAYNMNLGTNLTVNGALTINNGCTLSTGASTLTVAGTTTVNGVLSSTLNGTVDLNGDLTAGGAGTRQISMGQGSLTLAGANVTLANLAGGFTSSGQVTFDRAAAQAVTLNTNTLTNVTIATGSVITLTGSTGFNATGTFQVNANVTLTTATSTLGTLQLLTGTVNMNGGDLTVGTYSGAGGTQVTTGVGTFTVNTAFTHLGTLAASGGTVDVNSDITTASTGTFTMATGTLRVSGTTVNLSAATVTWTTGTLLFDANTNQAFTPPAANLFNLTLSKAALGNTVSLAAGTTVGGALALTQGTLSLPAATLNVTGALTSGATGALTTNAGTIVVTGATTWAGALNGAGGVVDLNGDVSGGGSMSMGTGQLQCSGATVNLGSINTLSFAAGGLLTLDGTGNQALTIASTATLQGVTVNKGLAANTVTLSGAGALTIAGTTTITSGILSLTRAVNFGPVSVAVGQSLRNTTTPSLAYQFNGTVTLNGELRFENDALTLSFGGGVNVNLGGAGSAFIITGGLGVNRIVLQQDGAAGAPQWLLNRNAGDTVTVDSARIQDGFVSAATTATSSTDLGGNTNWTFGAKTTAWTGLGATNLWSEDANWNNDRPANGDVVNFLVSNKAGTQDLAALSLSTLNMTNYTGTLTLNQNLTVTGVTTVSGTIDPNGLALTLSGNCTVLALGTLSVNTAGSTVSVGGDLELDGSLTGGTGTVTVTGNYLAASTGTINRTAGAGLNVLGATINLATTTFTAGALTLQGGNAQALTAPGGTITTLTVAKTGGTTLTAANNANVGTLAINSGILDLGATTLAASGAATVTAGTSVTASTGTLRVGGLAELDGAVTFSGAGTLDLNGNPSLANTSTGNLALGAANLTAAGDLDLTGLAALTFSSGGLVLDGASSPQSFTPTVAALANVSLQKNAAGNVVNLATNLTVSTALTVTTGTLAIGTTTLTLSGGGTPWTLGGGGSFTMGAAGTVSYTGTGVGITVLGATYTGNLSIGSGAAGTFTVGTATVGATLTLNANATLTVTDLTLSAAGAPLAGTGTFTTAGGIVRYTNAGAVTVAATTFPNLSLQAGAFAVAGTVTVALDLTVTGTLTPGANQVTCQRLLGAGSVNLLNSTLRLTGAANPFQITTVTNLSGGSVDYAGNSAQVRSSDAPQFTYGNLSLSGGGTASLTGGTAMYVAGNLSFQVNSTFGGTVRFEPGSTAATFACGSSVVNLASLVVNKGASTNTVTLTGADFILRSVGTLNLIRGTLSLACDLTVVQGTIGATGAPGDDAQLLVNTSGVDLTVGDGTNRTLTINDALRFGQGATDLRLILAASAGPNRATLLLNDPLASLTFLGLNTSQMRLETSTGGIQGLIVRSQANSSATITALHVSVLDNDASGVLGPGGTQSPIQAQGVSIDRGNNVNWTFTGGGALRIVAATVLGDGAGSIDRVRLAYSLPIDAATVGDVFQRFTLRQNASNPNDPPLQTITGTSASVVPSQNDNVLEVRFGSGVSRTDVTGLELRYSPPSSNQLSSDTGIPAAQSEQINPGTSPALIDGAAPVVIGTFFQDLDLNGGLDRLSLFVSEPAAFSAARGTSVSGFQPVTSTTDLGTNTSLTLQVAGESAVTINLTPGGIPRLTGEAMAARIQEAVRALVGQVPVQVTGHDPLKRPAYSNFTCSFTGGRYLLRAGVPLLFDGGTGTYRQDWANSRVAVVAGANDAAPQLKLGAANGGVEQVGAGDSRTGLSVGGAVNPDTVAITAGTDASLRIDGEDFRTYNYGSLTTGLENVALVLEGLVRATDNEARNPPNQVAYNEFVAIPDRPRGRLVLVSGASGPGSRVEVLSSGGDLFATTAALGSANTGLGASEPAGAANTVAMLDDLSVRGQDGSNLLLGATSSSVTIAGSVIVVDLSNVAGSGVGTPTFSYADDGDGGFLADRALVVNTATTSASNLPAGNTLVLVGDTDGDGTLSVSPGAVLLDAAQSVFPLGVTGVNLTWSWDYVSGPGSITVNGSTFGPPMSAISTNPAFSFGATVATSSASYVFRLTVTIRDQNGQPVVNSLTDANGQIVTQVTVNVTESAPVAKLGADQTVIGTSVTLDASGSFDPNGGAITFAWSAVDALGLPLLSTVFDDVTLAKPRFTPGSTGKFTVTVKVSKASATTLTASASGQVTLVDPNNFPPAADAGPDSTGRVNAVYALDGSASVDPEGTALTFSWTPVSLAAPATLTDPAGARPTFTPQVPGAYVWRLTVTDASGQSSSDDVTITIQDDLAAAPRLAPAAEPRVANLRRTAFVTQTPTLTQGVLPVLILERGVERQATRVDLAADPNDDPTPGSTNGLLAAHVVVGNALFASYYALPQPGDGDPVSIRFAPGQTAVPLVAYGVSGQSFVLDGTRSQDDGVISTFTWKQLSGPFVFDSRTGNLLAVVPATAGTYVFQLTVTDNVGLTSLPRQVVVPVIPAGNLAVGPPELITGAPSGSVAAGVLAGATGTVAPALTVTGSAGSSISIDATRSASRNAGALTFRWEQVSGPLATLTGADTATLGVQSKASGPLQFKVTVTDQNGVSTSELVWVTVGAPGRPAPVARLGAVPAQTLSSGTVEVTIEGSGSSGDAPLAYRWSQARGVPLVIDSTTPGAARVRITQPGTYEVSLQVIDKNGVLSSPATTTFEVQSTGDAQLASGASFKKSTGGCALGGAGAGPRAALLWLALLPAWALLRRGRSVRRAGSAA